MDPVQFNCPHCLGLFQVDPSLAGGQASCPICQRPVAIPELSAIASCEPPKPSEPPAQVETQLSCPWCAGVFLVLPEMAGQQVSCPHCTRQIIIPGETVAAPVLAPLPVDPNAPQQPPRTDPISIAEAAPVPKVSTSAAANREAPAKLPSSADTADSNLYPPGFASEIDQPTDPPRSRPESPPAGPAPTVAPRPATGTSRQPAMTPDVTSAAATPSPANPAASRSTKTTPEADSPLPTDTAASASDSRGPAGAPAESNTAKDLVIPTEEGGVVTLHEPERLVGKGANKVRLHSLSPVEKTRKRSIKSLIAWLLSVLVLIGAMFLLLKK